MLYKSDKKLLFSITDDGKIGHDFVGDYGGEVVMTKNDDIILRVWGEGCIQAEFNLETIISEYLKYV